MVAAGFKVVSHTDIPPHVWDDVVSARAHSPKLRYDWANAAAAAYSRNGALSVIVVGPVSRPDALLPLSVSPEGLHRHAFVANDDGGLGVPCRSETVLPDLADALIRLRMPVELGYYPANDPFIGELQSAARGRAQVLVKPQEIPAAPWLDLDPSWAEPLDHLKPSLRQSIRRNGRRLAEQGAVQLDFRTPEAQEVDAVLETMVEVESRSWKERTGTALVHDDRQQAFFRHYATAAAAAGRFHVATLSLDGRPLAMSLGEIADDVYWAYKIGYDEGFAKFGPGVLLQYHLIGHLAARGVTRIEMQGQLVDYKRKWTDQAVETVAVRIYPNTPRGMLAAGADVWRQFRKHRHAKVEAKAREGARQPAPGFRPAQAS